MTTSSYSTTIHVDRTPSEAFTAICDVRGWWTRDIEGPTDVVGAQFVFRGKDLHYSRIAVTELVTAQRVAWHVLDNAMTFVRDQTEWVDTYITFDISADEGGARIRFSHVGLLPEFECYDVCSNAWAFFITESLPGWINTGQGQPLAVHDGPQRVGG